MAKEDGIVAEGAKRSLFAFGFLPIAVFYIILKSKGNLRPEEQSVIRSHEPMNP
ncbi:hypothetical protein M3231_21925 [Neobacillus mesonae]|nr:hypothetical protein [Neobacillus mesonae]